MFEPTRTTNNIWCRDTAKLAVHSTLWTQPSYFQSKQTGTAFISSGPVTETIGREVEQHLKIDSEIAFGRAIYGRQLYQITVAIFITCTQAEEAWINSTQSVFTQAESTQLREGSSTCD